MKKILYTVYVFEQGKNSTTVYQDGSLQYSIDLSLSLSSTVDFAKTIK